MCVPWKIYDPLKNVFPGEITPMTIEEAKALKPPTRRKKDRWFP